MRLLVVTGLPATGKSTLARELAERYRIPLLAKDSVKEALLDTLGTGDAAESRRLSDLSFSIVFALLRDASRAGGDVVLEGNFRSGEHEEALRCCASARIAQVLCRVEEKTRQQRMATRAVAGARHAGHGERVVTRNASNDDFLELAGERWLFRPEGDVTAAKASLLLATDDWWDAPGLGRRS